MRPGHNSSGSFQKSLQAYSQGHVMFKSIEQHQLIDKDGAKSKSPGIDQPFCGYLTMYVKDALELLVEVLNRNRAQFVKDAAYLHANVSVRIGSWLGSHQIPSSALADLFHIRRIVMLITQNVAHFQRQFPQQGLQWQCYLLH